MSSAPSGSTRAVRRGPPHNAFDFGVFEGYEPQPAWEIWPAGYAVSFGFAMRIDPDPTRRTRATPVPLGSGPPRRLRRTGRLAAPAGRRGAADPADPPTWSDSITISPAST